MAQGFMTNISSGGSTPATFAYDKRRLDRLVNSFMYMGFGEEKSLAGNMGVSISFRRYDNLSAATTALQEGQNNGGSSVTKADLTATVYQYGDFVTYTDWINMVGVDGNVVKIIDELQVDQIADTFDQLVRDMLIAGSTKRYSDTSVADAATSPTSGDLDYMINQMERQNVKYLREKTLPGVQTQTEGLDEGYILFCHPDLRPVFENTTNFPSFIPVRHYPAGAKVLKGEFGTYKRMKLVATTNAYINANAGGNVDAANFRSTGYTSGTHAADVYYTIVIGKGAFGNVKLQGGSVKTILKPLGYKDELDQQGSVGWKMAWGGLVLQSKACYCLISACATQL